MAATCYNPALLTPSFAAARDRIHQLQADELADARLNPDCSSVLMDHGVTTRRAIVFLHGITSSPIQFRQLGEQFAARGYNVFIPRLPAHGYRDRLSREHGFLTQADYTEFARHVASMTRGLGEHLTVAGLSVGGVLAAWCAQFQPDVDLAVLIAPAFGPFGLPRPLVPVLSRLATRLPNLFVWWDPRQRERLGPPSTYPRFGTRAMAASFLVGADVYAAARTTRPATRAILTITNARDPAVNNATTRSVATRWRRHPNVKVREFQFGRALGPLHDIIAPYQPNARVGTVYPVLVDLIDAPVTRSVT